MLSSSCSSLFPQERQRSAVSGRALRRDRASVKLHDGFDNGEAEAGLGFGAVLVGSCRVHPVEAVEDMGNVFGGDSPVSETVSLAMLLESPAPSKSLHDGVWRRALLSRLVRAWRNKVRSAVS